MTKEAGHEGHQAKSRNGCAGQGAEEQECFSLRIGVWIGSRFRPRDASGGPVSILTAKRRARQDQTRRQSG